MVAIGHAQDGALGTNPVLTVTGEGRIHEQQHGQEHVLPVSEWSFQIIYSVFCYLHNY